MSTLLAVCCAPAACASPEMIHTLTAIQWQKFRTILVLFFNLLTDENVWPTQSEFHLINVCACSAKCVCLQRYERRSHCKLNFLAQALIQLRPGGQPWIAEIFSKKLRQPPSSHL